ncbi:MAG: carboxypeptidase regulatory-like domain-containing protein [Acidobacteriia bacterium]|nr:carboxypeptidase regulatory-like domain-containing protein [Terriglobia bacterium]
MHQRFQRHLPRMLGGFVLLIVLEFLSSRPAQAQRVRPVWGQVVTEEDAVVSSGATIVVEMRDGQRSAEIRADSQGRFEIRGLFRQTYLMTVRAEGFHPQQVYLDLKDGVGPVTMRIVMHRAPSRKTASPLPALTDMSAPKNARKAFQKAVQALQANRLDEAREKFEKAIAAHPCYARALTGLASIQIAARDLDGAAANLQQAMRCDP